MNHTLNSEGDDVGSVGSNLRKLSTRRARNDRPLVFNGTVLGLALNSFYNGGDIIALRQSYMSLRITDSTAIGSAIFEESIFHGPIEAVPSLDLKEKAQSLQKALESCASAAAERATLQKSNLRLSPNAGATAYVKVGLSSSIATAKMKYTKYRKMELTPI